MDEPNTPEDLLADLGTGRVSIAFSAMVFAFGIAAGFLLAFSGLGFLQDSAGVIAGVFLVALALVAAAGAVLWLLRDRILRRLFGIAESQVEVIAGPLADVAQGAARRDPEQAARSARKLIQVAMARYAWLATRRWIMTSLTALIAAMAALAGTALLFKQNDLLDQQNGLLTEQIDLLREQNTTVTQQAEVLRQQTALLAQDLELSEASRNAGLASALDEIASGLAQAVASARARAPADEGAGSAYSRLVPAVDPLHDLDPGMVFRVVGVSQSLRPYRFLDNGYVEEDDADLFYHALADQRDRLPAIWERNAARLGWQPPAEVHHLIDRPASPERGQLLRVLLSSGVRALEAFNFYALDLSFAYARGLNVLGVTGQVSNLAYADFSYATFVSSDFSGSQLGNARFRSASIQHSRFSRLAPHEVLAPFDMGANQPDDGFPGYVTRLIGADFSDALLDEVDLSGAFAIAARFRGGLLIAPDFRDATLSAADFRDTVIVAPQWAGAWMEPVDLDGAVILGEDPLGSIAAQAAEQGFDPSRWRAEPADLGAVLERFDWPQASLDDIARRTAGAPAWRISRAVPAD